jgi:hypothetical protein
MAEMDRADVDLYRGLERTLGADVALALVERLPSVSRDEQVTRTDMKLRFDEVDARFAQIDARFEQIDARFEHVDARFDRVDDRFGELEQRFDLKLDSMKHEMTAMVRGEINALRADLANGLQSQTRSMILALVGSMVGLAALAAALAPFL